jgi:hypothetical protein
VALPNRVSAWSLVLHPAGVLGPSPVYVLWLNHWAVRRLDYRLCVTDLSGFQAWKPGERVPSATRKGWSQILFPSLVAPSVLQSTCLVRVTQSPVRGDAVARWALFRSALFLSNMSNRSYTYTRLPYAEVLQHRKIEVPVMSQISPYAVISKFRSTCATRATHGIALV